MRDAHLEPPVRLRGQILILWPFEFRTDLRQNVSYPWLVTNGHIEVFERASQRCSALDCAICDQASSESYLLVDLSRVDPVSAKPIESCVVFCRATTPTIRNNCPKGFTIGEREHWPALLNGGLNSPMMVQIYRFGMRAGAS